MTFALVVGLLLGIGVFVAGCISANLSAVVTGGLLLFFCGMMLLWGEG